MESLYRKYRPQTFADVVGQRHVVGTLERAVLEGRTSHAYLFCGPRGTGKTTMARLLAKALMCEQGPGHLPDGTCGQCSLIAAGEHPDVYELDAASRTGVDNVREEIINRVGYAPVQGRYKVYIVDEVHMLTTAAFNALLKTLEEPPGHVVFVLCTTDPQKIPATILSRVQRFDFRPIGSEEILGRLVYVCEQEGFTYEDAALELVVRDARGGMRDALSTLEQLSVFGSGAISLDAAQDLLGTVSGDELERVTHALAARDVASLFLLVGSLVDEGRDLLQFTRELAAHLRDVYVVAAVGDNPAVLPPASDVVRLRADAQAFGSADRLARILALLGDVSREMSTAPNQRLVLEIAFTRIARPEADLTLDSLAERVEALERGMPDPATSGQPLSPKAVPAPTKAPDTAREQRRKPAPRKDRPSGREASPSTASSPLPAPGPAAPPPASPAKQEAPAPEVRPASSGMDAGAMQRAWRQVVAELLKRLPSRGSLLSSAMATSDNGTELVVSLPKGSSFALKMLERPDVRSAVEAVVGEVYGPRTLSYREGLGTDLRAPAPAAPSAAPSSSAVRMSASPSAAANRPNSAPAQPAPSYPMPWDAPAPAPAPHHVPDPSPAPAYDVPPYEDAVPYEEFGAMAFVQDEESFEPAPHEDVPSSAPRQSQSPSHFPSSSAKVPTVPSPSANAPTAPVAAPAPVYEVPDDLPSDLAAILENAFDVFGNGVHVSRDSNR